MSALKYGPNILLVMDDQHRFDFIGAAGADFLNTPNIDKLAAKGVRFTRCVTSSPSCTPARIALATGLQPSTTGRFDSTSYLPKRLPTMYQHFRDHGYRVGLVGKADLAKADSFNGINGDRPCTFIWGFTHPLECEGKMHAARAGKRLLGPYSAHLQSVGLLETFVEDYETRRKKGWIIDADHNSPLPAEHAEDAFIGRKAVEWLDDVDDDFPWFLNVHFVGPHDPFDPPDEYARRYTNAKMADPLPASGDKPSWVRDKTVTATSQQVKRTRQQYCALIEQIDDQLGQILQALENRGFAENTIVVFTSDHGEMLGDFGLYKKQVMYEPAIRVPLLIAGPDIAGNRISDALIETIDINPTLAQLAGLPAPDMIDAESFADLLHPGSGQHRETVISELRNCYCVRSQTHKLIHSINAEDELYDLSTDPSEEHNIANADPQTVRALRRSYRLRLRAGSWHR